MERVLTGLRAVDFSRCSTDEQKKNGYTIEDQREYSHHFIVQNNMLHVGSYSDEGVSATLEIAKRPSLSKMLDDAEQGKFDVIVFKCIDRFFRNVGEYYECQKRLSKCGVTWVSIEEQDLNPYDADAAFKINIYLSMAEYEAKKTSKRILFNNEMRIKQKGVVTGAFAFPWKVVGEKGSKHLERNNPSVFMDILEHYELYQSKSDTMRYMESKYNIITTYKSLSDIFKNPLLYGEYRGVADYVEPYITKERFDRLQEIQQNNIYGGEYKIHYPLFTSIFVCPVCKQKMTRGGGVYGNKSISYKCKKTRIISRDCPYKKYTSEKLLEKNLLQSMDKLVENYVARIELEKKETQVDNTNIIKKKKAELERLNNMFFKGRITEEEYDKKYILTQQEIEELKPVEVNIDTEHVKEIFCGEWKEMYMQLDNKHKQAFWRNTVKSFTINEDKTIDENSIIFL